jgi:hypothetical protein
MAKQQVSAAREHCKALREENFSRKTYRPLPKVLAVMGSMGEKAKSSEKRRE